MPAEIDINADAGEGFGRWSLGSDDELLRLVTTVNIACGFHAGDPTTMRRCVASAAAAGVAIGAHPGYPDLLGFGRRDFPSSDDETVDLVLYQTGALHAIAAAEGATLTHVKPHGALYSRVARSAILALRISRELQSLKPGIALLLAAGDGADAITAAGLPVVWDAACDLEYDESGHNIIERIPQAKDPLTVARRALNMARGEVETLTGRRVPIRAQSLCVHGDRPNAPQIAEAVRTILTQNGFDVRPVFSGAGEATASTGQPQSAR